MKKSNFFTVAMMIAVSTTCILTTTSCSDDDDITCTCTESGYGYSESRKLDPKSYGATNCSDLEIKLRMSAGYDSDFDYNCH